MSALLLQDYSIPEPADALIVALDGSGAEVRGWATDLAGVVKWVKVGMTTFYAEGPQLVEELNDAGFSVFLDLKMHDIPHQVEGAARSLGALGVGMVTVHASGGLDMVRAAVQGTRDGAHRAGVDAPAVLAVTVLTSMDGDALRAIGIREEPGRLVDTMARATVEAGAHGIVCSPREAAWMRGALGNEPFIVTPGVRLASSIADDQVRTMTPFEALRAGASHLVVGRPITSSGDVAVAAQSVLDAMAGR